MMYHFLGKVYKQILSYTKNMVKIEKLLQEGKLSRIGELELELERYTSFFKHSYLDNFRHGQTVLKTFPRWSIISGYYTMHDVVEPFLKKISSLLGENYD